MCVASRPASVLRQRRRRTSNVKWESERTVTDDKLWKAIHPIAIYHGNSEEYILQQHTTSRARRNKHSSVSIYNIYTCRADQNTLDDLYQWNCGRCCIASRDDDWFFIMGVLLF